MKQIYVALQLDGKPTPVGVLRFDSVQNFGYFTYLANYEGPPLDPINLDYRSPVDPKDRLRRGERVFSVDVENCPGLMHQVFADAMPGAWGMAVLQAEYPEIRQMKQAERLHWMGSRTSGAISFFVATRADEKPIRGLEELEVVRAKCAEFQAKLEKMGLEGVRNPAVASHGGVMPKASYEDAQSRHWIAKFDWPGNGVQGCLLEHATVVMAQRCGITTPNTKTLSDGMGGHMFLSERYDRDSENRFHKVSLMSLTGASDAGAGDYRNMFAVLKKVCDPAAWPQQRDELLRRMIFNVGMNVTDDHLRNHEVRLMPSGSWELTPAFDLMPVSGPSPHQCAIFGQARANVNLDKPGTQELWSRVAIEIGANPSHVLGMVAKTAQTIESQWPSIVEQSGMNRFNQMQALNSTEVGCLIPFPERSRNVAPVPLSGQNAADLRAAGQLLQRTTEILKGAVKQQGEDYALSKALVNLSAEAPRLAIALREAGFKDASDHMLMAPLKNAARVMLDDAHVDAGAWRDLEDAASSINAAAPAPSSSELRTPTRSAPR